MKIAYKRFSFRQGSLQIIDTANKIIDEYEGVDLKLTLRQLYYQFVSKGMLSNDQKSYNKLGRMVNNARMGGMIDWAAIEDRTRFLRGHTTWNSQSEKNRGLAGNTGDDKIYIMRTPA